MLDQELTNVKEAVTPVWCAVANVRELVRFGEGGQEIRKGTKQFYAGAKVYCYPPRWDWFPGDVIAIGHFRGKGYIKIVMPSHRLTNWHVELVYSPRVIQLMRAGEEGLQCEWNGTEESRDAAEQFAEGRRKNDEELAGRASVKQPVLVWREPSTPAITAQYLGWVEIFKDEHWCGVIRANTLLHRNYSMLRILFGIPHVYDKAVAGIRGLPSAASHEFIQDELFEVCRSYSWLTWSEIEEVEWELLTPDFPNSEFLPSEDWKLVFDMMKQLAKAEFIGRENVRLVTGFFDEPDHS